VKDDRLLEMRVFRAVVEAGGFTAASHVLGVSQSFVSQTVSNLERRLGVTLLQRSTRQHRLTEQGQRFLSLSRSVVEGLEEGEAAITSDKAQVAGVLRVSASIAFGLDQIVPRIPAYMAQYPDIDVRLSLSDSLANLIEENLDVAIRMGRLQDSSLVSHKICDLRRIVVASPAYLAAHGAPRTPGELSQHNCLVWHGSQDHLNRWPFVVDTEAQEVAVRGTFGSDNGLTLFQLCRAGVGIMRCAEHLAVPAVRSNELVALLTEYQWHPDTAIHAVLLRDRRFNPRVRSFVDFLVSQFRDCAWSQR